VKPWPIEVLNRTAFYPRRTNNTLVKRTFTTIEQSDVPIYLPNQFNGNPDPIYGVPIGLVEFDKDGDDTDNTVVVQM
jgi:hypothetical protein